MISRILSDAIQVRNLSLREAARQIGVAHTTVKRMLDGAEIDLPTVHKVSAWLGMDTAQVLGMTTPDREALVVRLVQLLSSYPSAENTLRAVMQRIDAGELSPDVILDAFEYLAFRNRE